MRNEVVEQTTFFTFVSLYEMYQIPGQENDSELISLDLRFNDIQAGGATVLAESLQVCTDRNTVFKKLLFDK